MYLVWASFFKVGSFNLINFVSNLFFTEIDFCKPEVIQGLVWTSISVWLAFLMEDIYQGLNWISSKNIQIKNVCFFSNLMISAQSTAK